MNRFSGLLGLSVVFLGGCLAATESDPESFQMGEDAMSVSSAAVNVMITEFRPGPATGPSAGFVEIFNTGSTSVSLAGWSVDDVANASASPHLLGAGALLTPGGRLSVPFSGINTVSVDRVRLVDAGGYEIDAQSNFYSGTSVKGQCFARDDDHGAWSGYGVPCTPGVANGSIVPIRPPLVINEFKPGSGGFVEIVNRSSGSLDLSGFKVDDSGRGSSVKIIPAGTVLAAGTVLRVAFSGINTSSVDLVRLLDAKGNELDRRHNGYAGASLSGTCFSRIPDGGQWADTSVPCSPGSLNGYGGVTPLTPSALQWIGTFSSATGPVSALELSRDGTYTATVNGVKQSGSFTASSGTTTYTMSGGASGVAWTAGVDPFDGALAVTYGAAHETLPGYPALEDACDATGGGWTDDDIDTPTGLYCVCPSSKVLIWSAGGCTD